ncbi:MAG TPA: glycosyltransferase family 2 protein, partial [Burkholderiaceae bacterium]|nr:glycosyltransferase family 2 protein [Burkholderiaceae bacterium]
VSGCGGQIFYDPYPSLRYRQHGGNLIGSNANVFARLARIRMLFEGRFRGWNDRNIQALKNLRPNLTPANRQILDTFITARNRSLLARLIGIRRSGVYRQTTLGNLGLLTATLFNKI